MRAERLIIKFNPLINNQPQVYSALYTWGYLVLIGNYLVGECAETVWRDIQKDKCRS